MRYPMTLTAALLAAGTLALSVPAAAQGFDRPALNQGRYTIDEQEWYDPADWFEEGEYEVEYQDDWFGDYRGGFDDIHAEDDWYYDYYDFQADDGMYERGYTTDFDYWGSIVY